ncbi:histidine kinase [Paracrocinitomix mangrovi]|uniref:sensor histidine kinase n=1 Tax=Paracrocinitomix mangrovi TaxID=2862509 RepID=UPI001C8E015F|nr:histidine kinase [Paracrocinitomix mangrovi]UKN02502.1 histidine kinase [Paracrocinitomix mangrovi]
MERKALFYWIAQIIGWSAYFIFSMILLFNTDEFIATTNLYIYISSSIAVSILISHSIRYFIIRYNMVAKSLFVIILWTLVMSLLAAILLELFQYYITEVIEVDFVNDVAVSDDQSFDWANFTFAVFRSILLFLLWTGFYLSFIFIEKSRNQEIQRLKLDASANEIELKNLRAQLNPHFLFNSLNSIRALVGLDPEQAKVAITRLSSLLRNSINLGKHSIVKLEDELELVKNYLELEKIRFEERLKIDYKIDENCMSCEVPPLMLQTIIENSIKHGISKSIDGGEITVVGKCTDNSLVLTVSNPGTLNDNLAENGVGVANTKKRLEILYGENGSFNIEERDGMVYATIKIDYR